VLRFLACLATAAIAFAAPAAAQDRPALEREFQTWIGTQVWADAKTRGVSRATFDSAMRGIALDWSLPDLKAPGAPPAKEQRQPEFQTPGRYVSEDKFPSLISNGRSALKKYGRELAAIEKRYGVPREIVVAIWGRETAYGAVKPKNDAVRSLATLGFIGARKSYFYPELLAALQILEGDHLPRSELKSSWAGAMGQPQFLPSKFLRFAVDGDGDGKRDIWNSVPDTLASIANYLRGHGWVPGRAWGTEIIAPAAVACVHEGPDKGRPVSEWLAMGAKPRADALSGAPQLAGHLLMPAGRHGPAFLVSENFYVLKSYNESDMYALFIGHLADRYRGDGPIAGKWDALSGFDRSDVRVMQQRLEKLGLDAGGTDGLVGFRTRVAIGQWQRSKGLEPTCFPDAELVRQAGR
jgi:lytic murein transglycosylase